MTDLERIVALAQTDRRPAWLRALPGAESPHYALLHALAAEFAPVRVLEIGTCEGVSAVHFAESIGNVVVTVDIEAPSAAYAQHLARGWGLGVHPITIDSRHALPIVERFAPFDVLYIDGAHDYESARGDYERFRPLLANGAIILCDDIRFDESMDRFWDWVPDPKVELAGLHGAWGFGVAIKAGS
jgi:predicted O-methyltransferase YrrM